jgi:hypothetical protein
MGSCSTRSAYRSGGLTSNALAYAAVIGAAVPLATGCRRSPAEADAGAPLAVASAAGVDAPGERIAVAAEASRAEAVPSGEAGPPPAPDAGRKAGPEVADAGAWGLRLGKMLELGRASSLTATARGIVFRTKTDELVALALEPGVAPPSSSAMSAPPSAAPAPAITRDARAYFISRGRLVRQSITWMGSKIAEPGGPATLETLAADAVDGTYVAATVAGSDAAHLRDVVAYIARPSSPTGDRRARLWIEPGASFDLSSDGAGATSVGVVATGSRVSAGSIDARSAMSPVHARTIDLPDQGPPKFGPDVVVFVGPPPESHTEITLAAAGDGFLALIPFPRDTRSFGLAAIGIGSEPRMDAPVHWIDYPNGIDPAPVASARFCGRTWIAYARPAEATPHALGVLALAPVDGSAPAGEIPVTDGDGMFIVSLAARADSGAWLAWVANGKSWARDLRCR